MGDEAAVFRKTATLNGAYTVDAGLVALARQIVLKKLPQIRHRLFPCSESRRNREQA